MKNNMANTVSDHLFTANFNKQLSPHSFGGNESNLGF